MKKYVIQNGDTFEGVAASFKIKDAHYLKVFHNLNCEEKDVMHSNTPLVGTEILIPDEPQYSVDADLDIVEEEGDEGNDTVNTVDEEIPTAKQEEQVEKEKETKASESKPGNVHDGKHFVIQKGMCQCNQGFKFPNFKVTTHQKHYWNDADGQSDYLAVTEDDLTFNPPAQPFGQCKLKPTSGGYLPCAYAPSEKWTKTYEKVKVMGKSCVTEISELICTTGGKITILKHGQQSEVGKSNVAKTNASEQQILNPVINFETFQEEINPDSFEVI